MAANPAAGSEPGHPSSPTEGSRIVVRVLLASSLLVCLLGLCVLAWEAASFQFWRHDDWRYMDASRMLNRVEADGRWLNYLIFRVIGPLDPLMSWCLNLVFIGGGLWLIFNRLLGSVLASATLVVVLLLFPGLTEQNTWPQSLLPASALFLVATALVIRYGKWWLPVAGILSFGVIQFPYYLLPLAVLPRERCLGFADYPRFLVPGLLWTAGLVLGYVVVGSINLVLFGHFGVKIDDWRSPNPATDLASLGENIAGLSQTFAGQITQWIPGPALIGFVALILLSLASRPAGERRFHDCFVRIGFAAIVMLSPYWTVIPLGLDVDFRSVLPLAVGLVALPYLLGNPRHVYLLTVAVVLLIGLPSLWLSHTGAAWFANATQAHVTSVRDAVPSSVPRYTRVFVDARNANAYFKSMTSRIAEPSIPPVFMDGLGDASAIRPAFREALGGPRPWICPNTGNNRAKAEECRAFLERLDAQPDACQGVAGGVCYAGLQDGFLAFRLR